MRTSILFALVGALALLGCNDEPTAPPKGAPDAPHLVDPAKSDVTGDSVHHNGRISFGGEVFGEFVSDGQLEGYTFTARADSTLTVDNTNKGSSRNLDSTLFLYGPADAAGFFGSDAIAFDDDAGWGAHAKIKDFTIPAQGDYLIVIGTYGEMGRGRYRVTLGCGSDACVVPCDAACASDDACSGQICDPIDGCLSAAIPDACYDLVDGKGVSVNVDTVTTSADGGTDTFVVQLGDAPDHHVTVWVESSNPDQAVVYPQKLNFCASGYEEQASGCKPIEDARTDAPESWSRSVEVTVTGVRSLTTDGDVPYEIRFTVVSEDAEYGALTLDSLTGLNTGDLAAPDLSDMDDLSGDALLEALYENVKGHRAYGYLGQNSARTLMFSAIDMRNGVVESLYNGTTVEHPLDGSTAYRLGFNTEHTWPQAQFDKLEPPKSDLHHVFPTDIASNSRRSSYDFGITDADASASVLGTSETGGGLVYQVRPERRGDVARAHFYMVARYRLDDTLGIDFDDNTLTSDGAINAREEEVLRRWNVEDPVDDLERSRNNRIEAYQGNRNPFIDRPELVDRIPDL